MGPSTSFIRLAVSRDGRAAVVWEDDPDYSNIYATRYNPLTATWDTPTIVGRGAYLEAAGINDAARSRSSRGPGSLRISRRGETCWASHPGA
jgi:hypothetical protein